MNDLSDGQFACLATEREPQGWMPGIKQILNLSTEDKIKSKRVQNRERLTELSVEHTLQCEPMFKSAVVVVITASYTAERCQRRKHNMAIVLVRYQVLFDTDRYLNFVRYSILDTYVVSLIFT